MDVPEYVDALCAEGAAMADCARDHLGVPIPSCPGWDVAELVQHMGEIHHAITMLVESRATDPDQIPDPVPPPQPRLIEWFEEGLNGLAETFLSTDPSVEVWSWSKQKDVAFWVRRMAVEMAIHRWDVEAAVESPAPIDPALATDGIDEFFYLHMPEEESQLEGSGETIHLHCVDTDGEWTLELKDGAPVVKRGHQKATVAARASASDLLLLLWRRLPASSVDVHGDEDLLGRFLAWMDLD